MTSGSPSVEAQLIAHFDSDDAGALEVTSGKKRWVFFFSGGTLVRTRSNLKSEQVEQLAEKHPDADEAELVHRQAVRRVWNACRAADGQSRWVANAAPKKTDTLRQGQVFIDALSQMVDEEGLRARLPDMDSHYPQLSGNPGLLDVADDVAGLLQGADGVRSSTDVVTFSAMPPRRTLACLWYAHARGVLTMRTEPVPASGTDGEDLDIMSMIDDAVSGVAPAAAPAPAEDAGSATEADPVERLRALTDQLRNAENHFQVLEEPWDAPGETFRVAYTRLARDLHPDRFSDASAETQDLATELFDKVRAAWEVLGDDEARRKYIDKVIHGKKSEEELAMEQVQQYWAAETEFKRGLASFNAGRISQAHTSFESAVRDVPDELEFQAYHAYTSFALGHKRDPEGAEAHLQKLRDVIEQNAKQERKLDSAWVLLGRAYALQDNHDQARKAFIQALRANPANADATLHMRRIEAEIAKTKKKKGFFAKLFDRG